MKIPKWTGTALWGAVGRAIGFSLIGFNYMGWVLGSTAIKMSEEASKTAIAEALTPYCVSAPETDPLSVEKLDKIEKATDWKKRNLLEESGWATPLDSDRPNRALADACLAALKNKT